MAFEGVGTTVTRLYTQKCIQHLLYFYSDLKRLVVAWSLLHFEISVL